jgi:hypothetical protein
MTFTNQELEILKTDVRGRVLVSPVRREALLDEFEKSGSSAMRFARLAGIKYPTFANWVQQRRKQRAEVKLEQGEACATKDGASGGVLRLFEAVVEDGGEEQGRREGAMRIELPGGCRLSIGAPSELPLAAELVVLIAAAVRARC